MTIDEYIKLFHKEQLNLVAFKPLFHCDDEVLRLVNAAILQEREACATVCDEMYLSNLAPDLIDVRRTAAACADTIRARGETK